ncbi:MAG: hypothetical protein H7223_00675 [Pedobacter sp.]|nr:hypothetical protein [Pedobacter sp.]
MKKIIFNSFLLLSMAFVWSGCEKQNYQGGDISPYMPLFDLRNLYKGSDITLSKDNMFGSDKIDGIVVSDHSGENLPEGLLIIQQKRRLGLWRGIAIDLGTAAANYVPGDSVQITVAGGVLKRVDGMLEITGVQASAVTKVTSGIKIAPYRVASSLILAKPNDYESVLVAIVKAGFSVPATPTETYAGDKLINDGFGNFPLHTERTATFAGSTGLNFNANYYGIIINKIEDGKLKPRQQIRTLKDVRPLSSTPDIASIIISGFMADVKGGDGNYEYMQFIATRDIDFTKTPFSVVVTNNAGASVPIGLPTLGWATGSLATSGNARTYKFNLTSGTVKKGEFFYVGGSTKMINGDLSTSMASSKWIRAFDYSKINGDGFGRATSGLFANSGNASGFAVFEGLVIDKDKAPVDVVFIGTGGSMVSGTQGYRIANTDFYDKVDVLSDDLTPQPFYRSGTNTMNFAYLTSDLGYFNKLGGEYDPSLGKWIKARTQSPVLLTKESPITEIEGVYPIPTIENPLGAPSTVVK